MFITFEGVDGSGKTTQCQLLAEYLKDKGCDVLLTREPGGGGKFSMDIRNILSSSDSLPLSELLAIYAARNEHIEKIIKPAIEKKQIVICDRFVDSSIVYFAYNFLNNENEMRSRKSIVSNLNNIINCITPNITFLIDIEFEKAKSRIITRKHKDKYDEFDEESMRNIILLYRQIHKDTVDRIKLIDGNRQINSVHENILTYIENILN